MLSISLGETQINPTVQKMWKHWKTGSGVLCLFLVCGFLILKLAFGVKIGVDGKFLSRNGSNEIAPEVSLQIIIQIKCNSSHTKVKETEIRFTQDPYPLTFTMG